MTIPEKLFTQCQEGRHSDCDDAVVAMDRLVSGYSCPCHTYPYDDWFERWGK